MTKALRTLSAQYEQAQQQHAAQVETLRRQVTQLDAQVTRLARDYRTLAETLRGRDLMRQRVREREHGPGR